MAPPPTDPVLELRGIEAGYGGLQVLFGIDLAVARGERLALLGTNGAGKSTILRVALGLLQPTAGAVYHDGDDITHLPTELRVARGIAMVLGGRSTCSDLTVRENLQLGLWASRARLDGPALHRVVELFPSLGERLDQAAGTLSGGEQQMVALGRALLGNPSLLVIDELSLGLAPVVAGHVVDAVRSIAAAGVTLLVVEQSLNVAASLCDRAVFCEKGEVRFTGAIDELTERGDLARSVFLGTS